MDSDTAHGSSGRVHVPAPSGNLHIAYAEPEGITDEFGNLIALIDRPMRNVCDLADSEVASGPSGQAHARASAGSRESRKPSARAVGVSLDVGKRVVPNAFRSKPKPTDCKHEAPRTNRLSPSWITESLVVCKGVG